MGTYFDDFRANHSSTYSGDPLGRKVADASFCRIDCRSGTTRARRPFPVNLKPVRTSNLLVAGSGITDRHEFDGVIWSVLVSPVTAAELAQNGRRQMYMLTFNWSGRNVYVEEQQVGFIGESRPDIFQGTLDLMVLKTLESMGPLHGYAIARRIEQVSDNGTSLNQGTIYPALLRLQQRGWMKSEWGTTGTKRRAKFYSLTRSGRKQIETETQNWERVAAAVARFLAQST